MKLSAVTAALRKATGDPSVELARGKGYYYFTNGIADRLSEQGVYGVARLHDMTTEQWVKTLTDRIAAERLS